MYKLLYLPVDKPLEDGCMILNIQGEPFEYKESEHLGWKKDAIRIAEPFLVSFEFNEMKIIGYPSKDALKWLKHGMEIKEVDCEERQMYLIGRGWISMNKYCEITDYKKAEEPIEDRVMQVRCPTCRMLH